MKNVYTVLALMAAAFVFIACPAPAPQAPAASCCDTAAGCASGVGVDEAVCTGELNGSWVAGTCNITTGACE
jgi:hypothetical protein